MLPPPTAMSTPLFPLLLVLACSLGWAGFDLLRKLLVTEIPPVALVFLLTAGSVPLFGLWAIVEGVGPPAPGYLAPALGSVLLNLVANLLFLTGMRIAPLSVTVPLLSLTPAFTTLLAVPLLGERPGVADAAGILMVIAGAIWLNWPRKTVLPEHGPGKREMLRGGLMVASTAFFWALTVPLDKMAVERAAPPLHGVVLTAGVAAGVLAVLLVQRRLADVARVRKVPGVLALALVVSCTALGLQFLALPLMYVGTIETLKRGIGNFMALVSGWIFFGEAVTVPKVLAVGLMAAGVGVILT
ncbi:MAG TPA: DMT family transporter [Thermoanaerobaculia bacterium]|nr:DMT family transporter [Thermoanaerobaculia bacterium]